MNGITIIGGRGAKAARPFRIPVGARFASACGLSVTFCNWTFDKNSAAHVLKAWRYFLP